MKISFWDILSILALLGVLVFGLLFLAIFNDPYTPLNPFKPPTLPPTLIVPTSTATVFAFPPTWTTTPPGYIDANAGTPDNSRPSSTSFLTSTLFSLSSFTPSTTPSLTSTETRTPTTTRTPTRTPTSTPYPTYTQLPTYTFVPTHTRTVTVTPTTGYPPPP
jgi:hypothetical protein